MKAKDSQLYFLAILPNDEILNELSGFKNHFANKYSSKASLNSLPHITLHMPFKWRDKKLGQLYLALTKISESIAPFPIELKNFNCFEPKTIFVDIVENKELNLLQYQVHKDFKLRLKLMNANYKSQAFHPHITLAFRDLTKDNFKIAWKEFSEKSYNSQFLAKALVLLKHNGKKWEIEKQFSLGV